MKDDVLTMNKLMQGCPVMVATLPKIVRKEVRQWVNESRRTMNNPLAALKAHENVGYLSADGKAHNSYQCSIPTHLVENSFWLAWTLRLTAKYWGMGAIHREFSLRKWTGHFDGYDIWTNFSYKGDDNPSHNHAGALSGVIYHRNHGHPTLFDEYGLGYEGKDGTMVMFPSSVRHHVEEQTISKERITLAFNIIKTDLPSE